MKGLFNRRWRGSWTQNTKDTIKFTICAVSFYIFKSWGCIKLWIHSSSFVSRWERLWSPVLPLQRWTGVHWRPQRPLPRVSATFKRAVCVAAAPFQTGSWETVMSYSGTCWNTRRAWGSGWQPIPTTSSLYTAKEGKVKSKNEFFFFFLLFADCFNVLCPPRQDAQAPWSALGLLTVTSLRAHRYRTPRFLIISRNKQTISDWFSIFPIRTAWNILARGGPIRAGAPSFRE